MTAAAALVDALRELAFARARDHSAPEGAPVAGPPRALPVREDGAPQFGAIGPRELHAMKAGSGDSGAPFAGVPSRFP
jgi:hypothetical protein